MCHFFDRLARTPLTAPAICCIHTIHLFGPSRAAERPKLNSTTIHAACVKFGPKTAKAPDSFQCLYNLGCITFWASWIWHLEGPEFQWGAIKHWIMSKPAQKSTQKMHRGVSSILHSYYKALFLPPFVVLIFSFSNFTQITRWFLMG